ncbi:MAG: SPOR domain-containing protein [Alphaproteobacteria bacterium]
MTVPDQASEPRRPLYTDEPEMRRRGRWPYLAVILLASVAAGVWYVLDRGLVRIEFGEVGEPPLIKADPSPTKMRPEEAGGMEVPNQDKLVYGALNPEETGGGVERLLPPPEEPLPKPEPETPRSEEQRGTAPPAAAPAAEGSLAPEQEDSAAPAAAPAAGGSLVPEQEDSAAASGPERAEREVAAVPPPAPPSQKPAAPGPAGPPALVQLGAYRSHKQAERAWHALRSAHGDLLGASIPVVQKVDLGSDKGVFFRLRVAAGDGTAAAKVLCRQLKARKQDCLVVSR